MPYWIEWTLLITPAFLWVYILLGIPWALTLLPRDDWHDRPLITVTGFALGSGLLTAMMFVLGSTGQPWLTRTNVIMGCGLLTGLGLFLAIMKSRRTQPTATVERVPFTPGEILLISMIVIAIAIRWVVIAYWPFTAYDALWVYGYEGRLYFLEKLIPASIGYYPQFLPLQFTFGQLIAGQINDTAARAVIPLLHTGSILAAYTLGKRNFNRRTGIFLAALWALYPAVGEWSRMGDLEIPLTFLVTLAATYFLMAWNGQRRNHYAAIAGLIYGIALWTKPTAGALALGVMLINGIELVRCRFNWPAYRPRFMVSLVMGVACAPLGGIWYVRNVLLGHNAVDFPSEFWYTLAERGGGQMIWLLIALGVLLAYLFMTQTHTPDKRFIASGSVFILIGTFPSIFARYLNVPDNADILLLFPSLNGLPRLGWFEWGMCIIGTALLLMALQRYARDHMSTNAEPIVTKTLWALGLAVPYFVWYFWRYSYHYRLSFAIVPLLALPTAVILAHWFPNINVRAWGRTRRWLFTGAIFLIALPGMILPLYDINLGWDYLWRGELKDDTAKRTSGNEALMWMIDGFEIYEQEHGEPPVIVAPGVLRLPFFFPQADIRIDTAPTRLSELVGVTYFVDSHPDGTGAYEGISIFDNQVLSALGRKDILRKAWWKDDGIFRYEIYELHLENRFEEKIPLAQPDEEIVFGDFAQFLGHEISSTIFEIGQLRTLTLYWRALKPADADYMIYIHLRDSQDNLQQAWDGPIGLTEDGRYYTTLVWEEGEYIVDERRFRFTNTEAPTTEGYSIVIGMYNLATNERVPVMSGGEPIGDGYRFSENITVIPPQEITD